MAFTGEIVQEYNPVIAAQNVGAEPPWPELFSVPLDEIIRLPHDSLDLKLLLMYHWEVAHHWVIKLGWKADHKPPFKHSQMQAGKPKGVYLHCIRSLCNFCFSESLPGSVPYSHPCYWLKDIYRELFWEEFCSEGSGELNKGELLRKKHKIWHQLKFDFQNPASKEKSPATWLLYEIALPMAEQSKGVPDNGSTPAQFQRIWQAFLESVANEIKDLEQYGKTLEYSFSSGDNKVFMQKGRGKGREQLTLSRSGSSKRRASKQYKS